jgi:hypothetical protein
MKPIKFDVRAIVNVPDHTYICDVPVAVSPGDPGDYWTPPIGPEVDFGLEDIILYELLDNNAEVLLDVKQFEVPVLQEIFVAIELEALRKYEALNHP